jgi:predicted amidohydrolase
MSLHAVVGQIDVGWDMARNRDRVLSFLRTEAGPGTVVVLPEAALTGYDDALSGLAYIDHDALADSIDAVAYAAGELKTHVLCGALLREQSGWCNAALYFGPDGERWTYRKVNLASHERGQFTAGTSLSPVSFASGQSASGVGVQLCRELRYPEQWHVLARRGAQIFAYLTYAANPAIPNSVWRSHLISRAAETQRFVLAANVAHPAQHCPSMIISPEGEVLAESTSTAAQALHAELDLAAASDWLLSQQRADVVGISYTGTDAGLQPSNASFG